MNFKTNYIILILICFVVKVNSQDLHFSQYYEQTPLRNPAIAGLFEGDVKVSANYRDQWRSVTKFPFKTGAANVEVKFPLGKSGRTWVTGGLQTIFDKAGEVGLNRTHILPFINLQKEISEGQYLSAGFIGGWAGAQFDVTKLRLGDQWVNGFYNPGNPTAQSFNRSTYNYLDIGGGVAYVNGTEESNNQFYIGLALFHVNTPTVSFNTNNNQSKLPIKWAANIGYSLFTGDDSRMTFHSDFYKQGASTEFISTVLYTISKVMDAQTDARNQFSFGLMYRHKDAIIPVVQLKHWKGLRIGLSYDANVSQLKTGSNTLGGLELNISKTFRLRMREGIQCPYFEY